MPRCSHTKIEVSNSLIFCYQAQNMDGTMDERKVFPILPVRTATVDKITLLSKSTTYKTLKRNPASTYNKNTVYQVKLEKDQLIIFSRYN